MQHFINTQAYMTKLLKCQIVYCLMCLIIFATAPAYPQQAGPQAGLAKTEIVHINSNVMGKLYKPSTLGPRARVGILIMHSNSDYLNHRTAEPFASRGFQVLTANTRYTGQGEGPMIWDNVILDVKAAFAFLSKQPSIEKIVLVGHSGGGPTMAYYQNLAENGVKAGQGPEKIAPTDPGLAGLTPADGLVLLDSHLGYAFNSLVVADPSVLIEGHPWPIDPSLDMYDKANGYDPLNPTYSAAWERRFFQGQAARMNRLMLLARHRLQEIEKGRGMYPDNEPFTIPRYSSRLWMVDLKLISHTKKPYTLLTKNGPVTTAVKSVRQPAINKSGQVTGPADNLSYENGVMQTNVRAFLTKNAIRTKEPFLITEDDIIGADYASTNTSTPTNLAGVRIPTLAMSMTAHYWVVPNEINFNYSASTDKRLVFVEGAMHSMLPAKPEYGDTLKMIIDYVTDWISPRFVY